MLKQSLNQIISNQGKHFIVLNYLSNAYQKKRLNENVLVLYAIDKMVIPYLDK